MYYEPRHGDLLARLYAVAQARSLAIDRARQKKASEKTRHQEEMRKIRAEYASVNRSLAELLEEAAKKRLPQAIISEVVGLSRQRMSEIRKAAK